MILKNLFPVLFITYSEGPPNRVRSALKTSICLVKKEVEVIASANSYSKQTNLFKGSNEI